jgi:hypothetical protein
MSEDVFVMTGVEQESCLQRVVERVLPTPSPPEGEGWGEGFFVLFPPCATGAAPAHPCARGIRMSYAAEG